MLDTVAICVDVQPLLSVTVTEYVPAAKLFAEAEVEPPIDHW